MTVDEKPVALKSCPFCGSDRVTIWNVRNGQQAVCKDCKSTGAPAFNGPLENPSAYQRAFDAWNTRASPEPVQDWQLVEDITDVLTRWDALDAGSPAAQGCANRLACIVANNRDAVLALSAAEPSQDRQLFEMFAAHIRNGDEPLDAMTDAIVAGIEAWKLNDETAIDTAIHGALDRIAKSIAALSAAEPAIRTPDTTGVDLKQFENEGEAALRKRNFDFSGERRGNLQAPVTTEPAIRGDEA